ncbi:DEAD/DEAH box helicase [Natronobacterium gregoryi]|uniref:DNA 3'-5' helicase n=2 Tax=Natronobacterium gregoryi TaxID=44930 RepID=L0ACC5_NATGS|nr:DEAD/DEAH box helicase family protein [Natronobacterium gregoryi]AFZ71516.1 DNA/RNA helicase, superfamily II [Natronobacterium gregoryi SP2]ELY66574.1 type III restriction protein res subunit [Natronobacterium gregoryi SP2]PLK21291.1 ATP-dependent helicase [Natronobacterium gregoryi SP2]SFI82977.1 DNA repair helicase RAD25 [Natronobacterium gregoryi]
MTRSSSTESTPVEIRYEDGTIRIDGLEEPTVRGLRERAPTLTLEDDHRTAGHRVPAFRYAPFRRSLLEHVVPAALEDRVLSVPSVPTLESTYELREYQHEALEAWLETDRWNPGAAIPALAQAPAGVLELPTGSGKTVVALEAIERLGVPTLVVVPTIDLLEQWERELEAEFGSAGPTGPTDGVSIGRLGGGEQRLEPLTVSTYDSAYLKAETIGDRFGLVVFDEVHHLGGEGYREIGRLLAAPARLGLTATFERPDGAHEVVERIVGPLVHRIDADELAGDHLASYDLKRLEVSLTSDERETYERNQETFTDYLARSNIRMQRGSDYQELVKRSGSDPAAREALLARQRARETARGARAKLEALEGILDRHRDARTIVFTAHNDLAYEVSERFLLPTITHRTATVERREVLERFREGTYSRIATSNVLDEGVDVPDASVAVVLSGSGSEREFTQRLGRILRPKDDGRRALLYEVITENTSEERVARRRRSDSA